MAFVDCNNCTNAQQLLKRKRYIHLNGYERRRWLTQCKVNEIGSNGDSSTTWGATRYSSRNSRISRRSKMLIFTANTENEKWWNSKKRKSCTVWRLRRKRTNPRAKSSRTVVATQVAPPSTRAETAGAVEEEGSWVLAQSGCPNEGTCPWMWRWVRWGDEEPWEEKAGEEEAAEAYEWKRRNPLWRTYWAFWWWELFQLNPAPTKPIGSSPSTPLSSITVSFLQYIYILI